jgi:Na+-translocating ferredoxin:NAD+ oxidoreductase RnfD subunit
MKLLVEIGPHKKAEYDTAYLMWQVVGGLLPAIIAAVIFFKILAVKLYCNE